MDSITSFEEYFMSLETRINSEISLNESNIWRRKMYTDLEIFRMKLEQIPNDDTVDYLRVSNLISKLEAYRTKLRLIPQQYDFSIIAQFDYFLRMLGLIIGFIPAGSIGSLIIMLCLIVEKVLGTNPFRQKSEMIRRWMAKTLLLIAGISVEVEGLDVSSFASNCVLLTFSHSSNLDGFLICHSCPIRHLAFAKKELFMVPFFSWLSLALGGVPVDRQHRDRAVRALKRSVESAKYGNKCFVIAPEGTRSLTGQLLNFKKGTFHMWEDIQVPIVPVVFFGAFELWPVGSWMTNSGNVVVRYLDPILPHEAKTRDEMSNLVRMRMLEALANTPENAAKPLSSRDYYSGFLLRIISICFILYSISFIHHTFITITGRDTKYFLYFIMTGSSIITCISYIYFVYIVNMIRSVEIDKKQS